MPTHLVIFDFDGVLADTEDLHRQAFDAILRELGLALSNEEYLRSYLGLPDHACLGRRKHQITFARYRAEHTCKAGR